MRDCAVSVARRDSYQATHPSEQRALMDGHHHNMEHSEPELTKMPYYRPIIDLAVLIALAAPPSFLEVYVEPYNRGFYCDDQSIRYPHFKDTVPNIMLYTIGGGIPALLIITVEALRLFFFERRRYGPKVYKPCFTYFGRPVNPFLSRLYYFLGYFAIGSAATVSITSFGKYSVGRLRPHFVSVCRPHWSVFNCTAGGDGPRFIYDPQCQGDPLDVREARLSWPSGHSSFGMFAMLYAGIYLQARGAEFLDYLLVPVLQFFLATLGFLTALSRISNYKHHPIDVFSGAILGIFMALSVTLAIGRFRRLPKFISQYQYFRVRMEKPADAEGGRMENGGDNGAGDMVEAYIELSNKEAKTVNTDV